VKRPEPLAAHTPFMRSRKSGFFSIAISDSMFHVKQFLGQEATLFSLRIWHESNAISAVFDAWALPNALLFGCQIA
jgi:hypothetical protein